MDRRRVLRSSRRRCFWWRCSRGSGRRSDRRSDIFAEVADTDVSAVMLIVFAEHSSLQQLVESFPRILVLLVVPHTLAT